MRRTIFGLLSLVVVLGLVATVSCQRENSLRIVSIEPYGPLFGDLIDVGIYRDPTDPEAEPEEIEVIPTDYVTIGVQYVEIGLGLPTWTPYQAHITDMTVTYNAPPGADPEDWEGTQENFKVKFVVPADPSGDEVVEYFATLITPEWKDDYGDDQQVDCTIELEGYDDANQQFSVEAENAISVLQADYYDDPTRLGQ